jgi:hypothetical protein
VSCCAACCLDQTRFAAQKAFLVCVENCDQRHFRQVQAFAQQIDPDQDIEVPKP